MITPCSLAFSPQKQPVKIIYSSPFSLADTLKYYSGRLLFISKFTHDDDDADAKLSIFGRGVSSIFDVTAMIYNQIFYVHCTYY